MLSKSVLEWFAKYRIYISKIIGVFFIIALIFSENIWINKPYAQWLALISQSIGLIMVTIATLGRIWSGAYLCGNKTHNLVTQGPYSIVRNPLYFFSFIGVAGIAITSGNITSFVLLVAMFILYYLPTILDEEKTLERFHKENLDTYLATVPRFIPNFSLLKEPDTYSMEPIGFRRTILDGMWFIWVYLILVIIERLHDFNILPAFFKLF